MRKRWHPRIRSSRYTSCRIDSNRKIGQIIVKENRWKIRTNWKLGLYLLKDNKKLWP